MRNSRLQRALGLLLDAVSKGVPISLSLRVLPGLARRHSRDFESKLRADRALMRRAVTYARAKQYLSVSDRDGAPVFSITLKGKKRLLRFQADALLPKHAKWDKRWRVVLFDIPHDKKVARDLFRGRLKRMGLFKIKDGAWVSPWPVYREVLFLAELYKIAPYIRFLLVSEMDRDDDLRMHFGL